MMNFVCPSLALQNTTLVESAPCILSSLLEISKDSLRIEVRF